VSRGMSAVQVGDPLLWSQRAKDALSIVGAARHDRRWPSEIEARGNRP